MKIEMSLSAKETASITTLMSALAKKPLPESELFMTMKDETKPVQVGPLSVSSYRDDDGIYHTTITYEETYVLGLITILLRHDEPLRLIIDGCKKLADGIVSLSGIKKEIVSFTKTFFKEEE